MKKKLLKQLNLKSILLILFFLIITFIEIIYYYNNQHTSQISRFPSLNPRLVNIKQIDSFDQIQYIPNVGYDLRSLDLTLIKLDSHPEIFDNFFFNSKTIWPFDKIFQKKIYKAFELGKDPGLNISMLHKKNIIGENIGIGVIDDPLLIEHQEYFSNIKYYEDLDKENVLPSSMHGVSVVSLLAGESVGVAPGVDIYYIANSVKDNSTFDFSSHADAILKLVEINSNLPENKKIRIIILQIGWNDNSIGYQELNNAIEIAKENNIFVLNTTVSNRSECGFYGLGRNLWDDPNDYNNYLPGDFLKESFFANKLDHNNLYIPMDARTTASSSGIEEYSFYSVGGYSWILPYFAGVYALALQVNPDLSFEEFCEIGVQTGDYSVIKSDSQSYILGPIINPVNIIEVIKSK